MKIKIMVLVLMATLVTIAFGLPPLTKESSGQNDDSYIPGVFILTDSVKKIQDQLKNEKYKKEESAKVLSEQEQGGKLSVVYHKDGKANDQHEKPRVTMINQTPVLLNHETNQALLTTNRLYTNQNQNMATSYQSDVNQHTLYLSHHPTNNEDQPTQTHTDLNQQVLYTNQQPINQQYSLNQVPNQSLNQKYVLNQLQNHPSNQQYLLNQVANQPNLNQPIVLNQVPNQPSNQQYILVTQPLNNQQVLPNQPIVLGHQQYISDQNANPSQPFFLANQQPLPVLTTQTQPLQSNQVTTQGLPNQSVILVQQPTQTGQPIIFTQQPNQEVFQPNQLALQNGQLEQTSNLLVATNQNGNQAGLWPKPAPNQAVYTVVTLGKNSNPSANGNTYLVSVPSAGRQ